ncbi:hypothetical protein DFH07DRAFT_513273 [Mycena maculata]|uniref:Uncharacterized protein n=1 Tax=Mycena maculata TaxID=230809 RepID=A0AAD7IYW7_9AGAR|nr:hypothetical protein DFH07DRAFT_513273 [Mycena maculata]
MDDTAHNHFPVLRVCALVCRDWLAASRSIMHGDIGLHGPTIATFLQLLDSPPLNTYFGTVRFISLTLDCSGPETQSFLDLLPKFVCLGSIHLENGDLDYRIPACPNISTVNLDEVEFPSFATFLDLMSRFPGLKNLTLGSLEFPKGSQRPEPHVKPSLLLEMLSVKVSRNDRLLRWLVSHAAAGVSTPRLTLIGFDDDAQASVRISGYLGHLNTSLKHLTLPPVLFETDFTANTALLSLSFTHTFYIHSDESVGIFPHIPAILQRFRLDNLEELILAVNFLPFPPGHQEISIRDLFAQLSTVLRTPQYMRVQSIRLKGSWNRAPDGFSRDSFIAALERELPHHASRFSVVD